jgi:hypothetical protein
MSDTSLVWWDIVEGENLAQGDLLECCPIPRFCPTPYSDEDEVHRVDVEEFDCLIMTQSCDLENEKARLVALCPVYTVSEFEKVNPNYKERGQWEQVRKGRVEGLHLLAPKIDPFDPANCIVVDFREIYSLPVEHLRQLAASAENRRRLCSPFLEHFSQAFARFFMRVGLPSAIPSFNR